MIMCGFRKIYWGSGGGGGGGGFDRQFCLWGGGVWFFDYFGFRFVYRCMLIVGSVGFFFVNYKFYFV